VAAIRAERPTLPIVLWCDRSVASPQVVASIMRSGVSAVVFRNETDVEYRLLSAITRATDVTFQQLTDQAATLAAAHVLFRHFTPAAEQITVATRSGKLVVTRDADRLTLDFPARPGVSLDISEQLVCALGARPSGAFLARDLLAIFECESAVRDLRPDLARVAALDAFGLIVSAPGETVDFVSRFFAPAAGIPEDPVTGAAHCTLVPYWAARLGKSSLTAKQLSFRGGDLACQLAGNRVLISGNAVEYLHGEIDVVF
jgi:predicted PhzF superfamily epimerase YddE/YHI9